MSTTADLDEIYQQYSGTVTAYLTRLSGSPELGGNVRLSDGGSLTLSKELITEALNKTGLQPQIRGEALSLQQFADFTNALASAC